MTSTHGSVMDGGIMTWCHGVMVSWIEFQIESTMNSYKQQIFQILDDAGSDCYTSLQLAQMVGCQKSTADHYRYKWDQKDVDALVIATPNHWHSLMTIYACQAGKHVYVEKPVSHSIAEGRKMVEAARKYNRIVEAGTQHRSCPAVQEAARDIKAG